MNPYVFIVGCPRSGTTLLRRLADAHSQLAVMPEQHWLPRFWEARVGMTPAGIATAELLDWLLADRRFELLDLPMKPVVELIDRQPHFAEFVSALFDLYGQLQGKTFVGEKTPKYVTSLDTLTALWREARIVHLIRDGRDVALSLRDWDKAERNVGRLPGWDEDPASVAALFWEWNVRAGREAGNRLGPERYIEVRYDRLIADPERECRAVCTFLRLAYEPTMLDFHVGRTRPGSGRSAKKAWQPVTPALRDWRAEMLAEDVARFETVAGPLLDELGYQRTLRSTPSRDAVHRAEHLRDEFASALAASGRVVPALWQRVAA